MDLRQPISQMEDLSSWAFQWLPHSPSHSEHSQEYKHSCAMPSLMSPHKVSCLRNSPVFLMRLCANKEAYVS